MDYLSLSRAARLAGITRAELQARIRRGEIPTFEGAVAVNDLLRAYPSVSLADDDALERTTRIKALAHPKLNNTGETTLPDPEVLLSRLQGLSAGLAERATRLDSATALLDQISEQVDELCRLPRDQLEESLLALRDWPPSPIRTGAPNSSSKTPFCDSWPPTSNSSPADTISSSRATNPFSKPRCAPV